MNISDEAVQVVHSVICEESLEDCMDPDWRGRCVKAVEAASPHLMAVAWDEGRTHGAAYPYGKRGLATDDNPYRHARAGE
jgi:hypothetical protein